MVKTATTDPAPELQVEILFDSAGRPRVCLADHAGGTQTATIYQPDGITPAGMVCCEPQPDGSVKVTVAIVDSAARFQHALTVFDGQPVVFTREGEICDLVDVPEPLPENHLFGNQN